MADETNTCPICGTQNESRQSACQSCGRPLSLLSQTPDPLIGKLIGDRFVVLERVAQGGMGVVYKAEQTSVWRTVAVKVLRPRFSHDRQLIERFRNEATTASQLTHPNTITIYDFGMTHSQDLYIAMEWIDGTDLSAELKGSSALEWPRACYIARQICGSLQEAHDHGIIHRDLKPENVMLTQRGMDRDVVKVLDFGIAKITAEKQRFDRTSLTSANEIFGTPEYMAPEQIRAEKLDHRSDIYALGIILYRMLGGHTPFSSPTPVATLAMHLGDFPDPLRAPEGLPALPDELVSLSMSALSKKRQDRPQSMSEVATALARILKSARRDSTYSTSYYPTTPAGAIDVSSRAERPLPRPKGPPGTDEEQISQPPPLPDTIIEDDDEEDRATRGAPHPADTRYPVVPKGPFESDAKEAQSDTTPIDPRTQLGVREALPPSAPGVDSDESDVALRDVDFEEELGDGTSRTKKEITLSLLAKGMKNRRDFPAMAPHISELSTKSSRQDTSARQLANVILRDYGLTTKLLKLVNSPFYGQYKGRVTTVSRAVVILGFEEVRQMALSLMMFEQLQATDGKTAGDLRDSTMGALMTGLVAKGVAQQVGSVDTEEAFICGMLRGLGRLLAIFYLPEKARRIRALMEKQGRTEDDASAKILGLSFRDLGQLMARKWELPEQIQKAMEELPAGKLGKARDRETLMRDIAGLSDAITKVAADPKPVRRSLALKRLSQQFDDALHLSEKQLEQVVQTSTDELHDHISRLRMPLHDSRFVRRLLRWTGHRDLLAPTARVTAPSEPDYQIIEEQTPAAPTLTMDERLHILSEGISEVRNDISGRCDVSAVVLMILETMFRGLSLSHVVFCSSDPKTGVMVGKSGLGDRIENMISAFRFRPKPGPDAFSQAILGRRDIVLDQRSPGALEAALPAWYRTFVAPKALILLPIAAKTATVGLFYADITSKNAVVEPELLNKMKELRDLAAKAIGVG